MQKQTLIWGLSRYLEDNAQPVYTDLQLFKILRQLVNDRQFDGQRLDIRRNSSELNYIKKRIKNIASQKASPIVLDSDFGSLGFPKRVWRNQKGDFSIAAVIACIVDPFCYISHLSAMRLYGLTIRNPKDLFLTVPSRETWRELTKDTTHSGRSSLYFSIQHPHISIPGILRKQTIHSVLKKKLSMNSITQSDGFSRVVPIGRCFIDMVSDPHLCGGMLHVIDVFKEHGQVFKNEIIDAAESDDRPIVKIRTGYLLDEVLGIKGNQIDSWVRFSQRGSSRKLDPQRPFDGNQFSEKWMISLNV